MASDTGFRLHVRTISFSIEDRRLATGLRLGTVALIGLAVANCGQSTTSRRGLSGQEAREIGSFTDPKYGRASERVVSDGQAVPKGGGRDLVGKPYRIAGKRYVPREKPAGYTATGNASWYGPAFHGRRTANGEVYDRFGVSAAHPTMPLPSYARVTNLRNKRSIIVRVNDRGPFHGGRIIDLSQKTAEALDYRHLGTAPVRVEYLGRASMRGSDDRKLLATLTTDGNPASFPGNTVPGATQPGTMLASLEPPARIPATTTALAPAEAAPEAPGIGTPTGGVTVATRQTVQVASLGQTQLPALRPTAAAAATVPVSLDLMTIPNAALPISVAVPDLTPVARSQVASLFYAKPEAATRFARGNPFDGLRQGFAPLAPR